MPEPVQKCENYAFEAKLFVALKGPILLLLKKSFITTTEDGSPGLVLMGGDSCSKGRGFECQHRKLDGGS